MASFKPVRMVPENDIHSIELLNKTFHSKPKMKYYKNTWYPSSTQNLIIKEQNIQAFQRRVDHPHSFPGIPGSKRTKFETFMILFNFKAHSKM